jgi:glycosyltransferase involved in cell wall biosynthesis
LGHEERCVLGDAPTISVLIPTYRPDAGLLRQTLLSVLQQDPGPEVMEIEIVDDASPDNRPDEIVRQIGAERVGVYRQPRNLGLAGNWNSCIERARGEWIHILHQDDCVYPGFYSALRAGLTHRNVAIAFCRHAFVDSTGDVIGHSDRERESAGVVEGFLKRIASGQRIQFSSALLRRSACLESGGFDRSLVFALDWEMWARLASRYAVWFEPRVLACFRIHDKSTGWDLARSGRAVRDNLRAIALINTYVPADSRREVREASLGSVASYTFGTAARLIDRGEMREGIRCGLQGFAISPTRHHLIALLRLGRRALARVVSHGRAERTSLRYKS